MPPHGPQDTETDGLLRLHWAAAPCYMDIRICRDIQENDLKTDDSKKELALKVKVVSKHFIEMAAEYGVRSVPGSQRQSELCQLREARP